MDLSQEFFRAEAAALFGAPVPFVFYNRERWLGNEKIKQITDEAIAHYGLPEEVRESLYECLRDGFIYIYDKSNAMHKLVLDGHGLRPAIFLRPQVRMDTHWKEAAPFKGDPNIEGYISFSHECGHGLFKSLLGLDRTFTLLDHHGGAALLVNEAQASLDRQSTAAGKKLARRWLSCLKRYRDRFSADEPISSKDFWTFESIAVSVALEERLGLKIKPNDAKVFEESVCEVFACLYAARHFRIAPQDLLLHTADSRLYDNCHSLSWAWDYIHMRKYNLTPLLDAAAAQTMPLDELSEMKGKDIFLTCVRLVGQVFDPQATPLDTFRAAREQQLFNRRTVSSPEKLDAFIAERRTIPELSGVVGLAERLLLAHRRLAQHTP